MSKENKENKEKQTYSGDSIASKWLSGTWLGNLLGYPSNTYIDGYGTTRNYANLKESAQGQQLSRMKDTAKNYGKVALTGMSFGNPLVARSTIGAVLPTGAQSYFITEGLRDAYNRFMKKDKTAEDAVWTGLNLAGAVPAFSAIRNGAKYILPTAAKTAAPALIAKQISKTKLPATEPLLNVGWAPKQTIGVTRAGEYDNMFYPNRYDVVHGNANPFGVWLQGKVGTPKPGLKAQIARNVMANRPAQYRGTVTLGKPIASVGEVSDRDALSRIIEGTGADGIIYNNVYDNGFNNNQVIHSFVKPELVDINKPAVVKYYGPTMGKSFAAKSNPNLIDLDTWGMPEYNQLAKKYGYKDWREMILSDKGDYNQEYKTLIKDQIRRIQADPQYNGKTIVVSNASLLKPDSGITFANTPLIPERSILAFRNHQRHPWESIEHGKQWWDSLQQKGTPLTIDNRFISDIELTPGNTTLFNTSFSPKGRTSYAFFERPSKLSEAERLGILKGARNQPDNTALPTRGFDVIPTNKNNFYRVSGPSEITDISEFGKLRIDPIARFDQMQLRIINEQTGIPMERLYEINASDNPRAIQNLVMESEAYKSASPFDQFNMKLSAARPKSNHGDKGFQRGAFFSIYDPNNPASKYYGAPTIVGTTRKSSFLGGHHGDYRGEWNLDIPVGSGQNTGSAVLRSGFEKENFKYWKLGNDGKWYLHNFKQGGILKRVESGKSGIHIKKKNRGKFTASAKRAGMGVQEYARKVLNDPNATPLQRRRANFARNAKKFKHN